MSKHLDSRFLLDPFEPAFLALHRAGWLGEHGMRLPIVYNTSGYDALSFH